MIRLPIIPRWFGFWILDFGFWILDTIAKGEASARAEATPTPTASALATACRRHRQTLRERNAKGKAVANSASFGFWIVPICEPVEPVGWVLLTI